MKTALDKKIQAFEKDRADARAPMFKKFQKSKAARVAYEFLVATLFFAGIGFALDYQLDTKPWIMLAMFFIGFITGIYNAWRGLTVSTEKVGTKYKAPVKSDLGSHDIDLPAARKANRHTPPEQP